MNELKKLFENESFLVIDKPKDIEFHSEQGILNRCRKEFGQVLGVHRLDRETSGVMIFAKNKASQVRLSQLFEARKILKIYIAVGGGKPSKKQGLVKGDLVKSRDGNYKLLRTTKNPAVTSFSSFMLEPGLRGFILRPLTGKTHQLRVVLKSLGSSILGDKRYSKKGADRLYLHAYSLAFEFDGELFSFNTEFPLELHFKNHQSLFIKEYDTFLKNLK